MKPPKYSLAVDKRVMDMKTGYFFLAQQALISNFRQDFETVVGHEEKDFLPVLLLLLVRMDRLLSYIQDLMAAVHIPEVCL